MTEGAFTFEKFEKRGARLVKAPELTIQAKGILSMNASAYHAIGEPEAVELLFDSGNQVIGLRPVEPEDADAYPVRPVGGGKNKAANSFLVAGTAFLKYFDVPFGVPTRREVEVVDGILIVDLKKDGRVVSSNRARRKRDTTGPAAESPSGDQELPGAAAPGTAAGEVNRTL